jgi:YegS/Rv2252/BmrU family lipid kinase
LHTFFIVNPLSRCGTTARIWQHVEKQVRGWGWDYRVAFTEGPGHGTVLAASALENGCRMVVAVGGDGTLHEVINGFFPKGKEIRADALLGLLPSGTGTDFAKTIGVSLLMEKAAQQLRHGDPHPVDLGWMTYQDFQGRRIQRLFANIAEGGLGGEVVRRVNSRKKRGGTVPFLTEAIRSLFSYQPQPVRVQIDDRIERKTKALFVIVANGRFYGGGMKIAPQAEPDDGLFDVVLIKDLSAFKVLRNIYRIYTGSHIQLPEVEVLRGKKVLLESEGELLLEADGELLGKAPAEFEICHHAVQVKC